MLLMYSCLSNEVTDYIDNYNSKCVAIQLQSVNFFFPFRVYLEHVTCVSFSILPGTSFTLIQMISCTNS